MNTLQKTLSTLLLLLCISVFGQQIIFQSARTADPLSKVQVFTESGTLLATSDIVGSIDRNEIEPPQDKYILIYDGYQIASLNHSDLVKEVIKLNDRVREIEEVTIKTSDKSKYMIVRGHFNVYMTVNKELNVYADGIATYTFDNNTRKLKSAQVEQYRAFSTGQDNAELKKTNTFAYEAFLKLPDLENVGRMPEFKEQQKKYREIKSSGSTKMEFKVQAMENKTINFFGYRMYDLRYNRTVGFQEESVNLRDFKEFDEQVFFKFKHKSEPDFHQMIKYATFVPVAISFSDQVTNTKLKLDPEKSFYSYEFWKANGFPNMQPVFAGFFKDKLKEQRNAGRK